MLLMCPHWTFGHCVRNTIMTDCSVGRNLQPSDIFRPVFPSGDTKKPSPSGNSDSSDVHTSDDGNNSDDSSDDDSDSDGHDGHRRRNR